MNFDFSYSPARRLAWWYELMGRREDAKKLRMRFVVADVSNNINYPDGYREYQRAQSSIAVAQEFVRDGEPVEAVRLYNKLLADPDLLELASRYGGETFDKQVELELKQAIKELKSSALPAVLQTLLVANETAPRDRAVLDLVLLVDSRDLDKATLNSLFATAIKATDKTPEIRREAMKKLAELAKNHPTDLSVLTANVLGAFAANDPAQAKEAVALLMKVVEAAPLEPLPASGKANARQRAEARLQISIWLAARECLAKGREPFWPAGEKLAARAAAASKRQPDALLTTAIFREWGQLELDRGNKEKAQAHWTELLEWKLAKKPAPKTDDADPALPSVPKPAPALRETRGPVTLGEAVLRMLVLVQPPPTPQRGRALPNQPAPRRPNPLALTEEQFKAAYEIAVMAIDKQMPELCLRAMHDAVRGGPPVVVANDNRRVRGGGMITSRIINGTQYYVQGGNEKRVAVDRALLTLATKLRAQRVPLTQVYDLLVSAVLPEARAKEVFLYAPAPDYDRVYIQGPNGALTPTTELSDDSAMDRGLGNALVQAAIDAGKIDDLRARLEARAAQPLGELPAKILLAMLAVQAKDEARVKASFATLSDRLKKDSLQSTNATIAGVLIPALGDPGYAKLIIPILDKAAQNYLTGGNAQAAAELRFKLAEQYLHDKDEPSARAQLKLVEAAEKKSGSQVYDVHLALANEYLKLGWVEEALGEFAFNADNPFNPAAQNSRRIVYEAPANQRNEPSLSTPGQFERLAALLLSLPAAKRYEVLKVWSLPTSGRKSVRYYVGTAPKQSPPEIFARPIPFPKYQVLNTMLILADAAKEAGKSEELLGAADALAKDNVENADLLKVLACLTLRDGKATEPIIKAYAEKAHTRLTAKQELPLGSPQYYDGYVQLPLFYPSELLVATLCLGHPTLAAHGEHLLGPMQKTNLNNNFGANYFNELQTLQTVVEARRAGAPHAVDSTFPPHWRPLTAQRGWLAQDGYLTNKASGQASPLLFDVPLTGSFAFTVESRPATAGSPGYGGLNFYPGYGQVSSQTEGDTIRVDQVTGKPGAFGPTTIQVEPGKIRCLVDGQLFYEDLNPAPTSPWLMLRVGAAIYRHVALSGKPVVPAEVSLSSGDFLEGWQSHLYPAVLPKRLQDRWKAEGKYVEPNFRGGRRFQVDDEDDGESSGSKELVYDWLAKDGEIRGRKLSNSSKKASPSSLAYFRPLQLEEKLRYEFFYEPGGTQVHPSLGRVAFLLEPDGLKLHWMTEPVGDWTGLAADNAVTPAAGASTGKLPLNAGAWNAVALAMTKEGVRIELNGTVVYQSKVESENDRRFGFFHYRDRTDARVRNVVLLGNWDQTLATQENMTLAAKAGTPAEVKVRRGYLGEPLFAAEAGALIERAHFACS